MENLSKQKIIYNVSDLAELFNVKETTIKSWAKRNLIPAYRIGKFWYVNEEDLFDKNDYNDQEKVSLEGGEQQNDERSNG